MTTRSCVLMSASSVFGRHKERNKKVEWIVSLALKNLEVTLKQGNDNLYESANFQMELTLVPHVHPSQSA